MQQATDFWQSDNPQNFEFKAYQIAIEYVAQQANLKSYKPLLTGQLVQDITNAIEKNYIKDQAQEQVKDPNKIAQRRVYLTPTLKLVGLTQIENSSTIIRNMKFNIEYLMRIKIMQENMQEEHFVSDNQDLILKTFVKPYLETIWFCGMHLMFLNYSPSQIKQKSWWVFVHNHGFDDGEIAEGLDNGPQVESEIDFQNC